MMQKKTGQNRQTQRSKSWIFDALMILIEKKPYNKITITDITEKAGVSRPTFYRNFKDKDNVVFEYLAHTFSAELHINEKNEKPAVILLFDYGYMMQNRRNLKKILSTADIENRIYHDLQKFPMSLIRNYRDKLSAEDFLICRYKLCYQITGSLQVIFDWFINDMPLPVSDLVSMLNAINIPKTIRYRNLPTIKVKIKE